MEEVTNMKHISEDPSLDAVEESPDAVDDLDDTSPIQLSTGAIMYSWADKEKEFASIEYDFDELFPRGFVTMIVGATGSGKSMLALAGIASSYINGSDLLDIAPFTGQVRHPLWAETEVGLDIHLERCRDFGIPSSRIRSIESESGAGPGLESTYDRRSILEAAKHPSVGAIFVDSLSGGHDRDENSTQMISVLRWLAELAEETDKAVYVIHHLNKIQIEPGEDITPYHVRGSTSILQFARVVIGVNDAVRRDSDEKRVNIVKTNLRVRREPWGFKIADNAILPFALPNAQVREDKSAALSRLLETLLVNAGGELPAQDVEKAVVAAGFSVDRANRAKKTLGIESLKRGDAWYWTLRRSS